MVCEPTTKLAKVFLVTFLAIYLTVKTEGLILSILIITSNYFRNWNVILSCGQHTRKYYQRYIFTKGFSGAYVTSPNSSDVIK